MAARLKVRRPTPQEGERLLRIVRRGHRYKATTWRRALIVTASAGGNSVGVIANLVQTSEDRVREVIHAFNQRGLDCLDPKWAGGRPRHITARERALIVKAANKRPRSVGQPFTRWSIRKLRRYLATKKGSKIVIGRERLRQILDEEGITFQKTKTWKESNDPLYEQKCARIEEVVENSPTVRVRRVRPASDPPAPRELLVTTQPAPASTGQLQQEARDQDVPRLLLGQRRHHLGEAAQEQVGARDVASAQEHPRHSSRR